jgi:RNA polymerase sigma factor for flagellar operon FliA
MNVVEEQRGQPHAADTSATLVQRYSGLVAHIARQLAASLPPSVDVGDLIQAGMIGLLQSAGQFDASRGAPFEAYISIRIRGAMLDELRELDWAPRAVRRNARLAAAATRKVECRTGRDAESAEIAAELGIDVAHYHEMAAETARAQIVSMSGDGEGDEGASPEAVAAADPADGPQETAEQEDLERALNEAVLRLPSTQFRVVSLHYAQDLPLAEIGKLMGVSVTRVRDILSLALADLRRQITSREGSLARREVPLATLPARWRERRRSARLVSAALAA